MIVSGWTVDRGRSYELDKNATGTATVTMIDTTGEIDPTNSAYDFAPGTPAAIALRNPVTATETPVFVGHIARLRYDLYPNEEYAVATLELVDGFELLAKMEMYAGTGFVAEWGSPSASRPPQEGDVLFEDDPTGSAVANRLNLILDQAGWPSGLRDINSGNVRLQEVIYPYRTPALTACLDAADAEFPGVANFFVGATRRAGKATFQGRLARFNPDDVQYDIDVWKAGDMAAVAEDSTRALIFGLDYDVDVNKIINSAIATPRGMKNSAINAQRVENAASIATHGSRSVSFDNLLTAGDFFGTTTAAVATKKFATYYVSNFKDPQARVNRITFKRVDPDTPYGAKEWALLCGVDISDIIRLKTTHFGGEGGFDEDFYVEGLHYRARPLNDEYVDVELDLDVSPRAYYNTNPWA